MVWLLGKIWRDSWRKKIQYFLENVVGNPLEPSEGPCFENHWFKWHHIREIWSTDIFTKCCVFGWWHKMRNITAYLVSLRWVYNTVSLLMGACSEQPSCHCSCSSWRTLLEIWKRNISGWHYVRLKGGKKDLFVCTFSPCFHFFSPKTFLQCSQWIDSVCGCDIQLFTSSVI